MVYWSWGKYCEVIPPGCSFSFSIAKKGKKARKNPLLLPQFLPLSRKKGDAFASPFSNRRVLALLLAHLGKALTAVDGTVGLGLERNLRLSAAPSADRREVLTGTAGSRLAGVAAGFAALRLILEAALGIEFLLTSGKHKLLATFLAYKRFVFVHDFPSLCSFAQVPDPSWRRWGICIIAFSFR